MIAHAKKRVAAVDSLFFYAFCSLFCELLTIKLFSYEETNFYDCLPSFGYKSKSEDFAKGGAGSFILDILFAMAFCPTSGVCYFGMLIPLSATVTMGYLLPVIFAIATSLPVIIVAWILAFSTNRIGEVYGKMQIIQKWLNVVVGVIFILIGLYYCLTIFF
jgi:hypothetical protein